MKLDIFLIIVKFCKRRKPIIRYYDLYQLKLEKKIKEKGHSDTISGV